MTNNEPDLKGRGGEGRGGEGRVEIPAMFCIDTIDRRDCFESTHFFTYICIFYISMRYWYSPSHIFNSESFSALTLVCKRHSLKPCHRVS